MTPFWYANYQGEHEVFDDNGYQTGELKACYSDPVKAYGTLNQAGNTERSRGYSSIADYGVTGNFIVTIVTDDKSIQINTSSRLWINNSTDEPPDFQVIDVGRSLNAVRISAMQVTNGRQYQNY